MGLFGSKKKREKGTRLFFATDIHGSGACFRKFLNSADVFDCDHLVLGGDITGKILLPVVDHGDDTFSFSQGGHDYAAVGRSQMEEVAEAARRQGDYPYVASLSEIEALQDEAHCEAVFRKVVYDSVSDWVTLAEERLKGTGKRLFMAPGNDDFFEIDGALEGSDVVEFAENRCLQFDEHHKMITTGFANPTPWDTERELPEDQLRARIDAMAAQAGDTHSLIAVLHPPPFDSTLDSAPKIDSDLNVEFNHGVGVVTAPVGSTAVRGFIEDAQPILSLHGHVHEGGGSTNIGRTLSINPGSAYTEGTLVGAVVEIGAEEVISHQFISG
ncbi:MAG TPA: hypothetical protein VIJ21_09335 [Solirubrobacterales bacterium]